MIVSLTDFGKEFQNKDKPKSEKNEPANSNLDELSEGNWGLDLINTISDEFIRYRENNSNKLIIKKNLTS